MRQHPPVSSQPRHVLRTTSYERLRARATTTRANSDRIHRPLLLANFNITKISYCHLILIDGKKTKYIKKRVVSLFWRLEIFHPWHLLKLFFADTLRPTRHRGCLNKIGYHLNLPLQIKCTIKLNTRRRFRNQKNNALQITQFTWDGIQNNKKICLTISLSRPQEKRYLKTLAAFKLTFVGP